MVSFRGDDVFMREALRLAKKGAGRTGSNPLVGAIIVRGGRIVGRGYHRGFGMPHAEIEALRVAGEKARGAILYTTLEPCRHFGKTPPCAEAIVKCGILRVVCATRDPHRVARGGVEKLRKAGIRVSVGICAREARGLNEVFFTFHEKKRPFVALKFAASLDGKLATRTGDSKWITDKRARSYARKLRGMYPAVLVGIDTVIADDPHLGARTKGLPDPLRIVLDSRLRIPLSARVLRDSNVLIATTKHAPARKKKLLENRGARILTFGSSHISPKQLLVALHKMSIVSVLVEGGGKVLGSFIDAGFADKVYAFYAPILIGGKRAVAIGGKGVSRISDAPRLTRASIHSFDEDVLIVGSLPSD